MAPTAPTAPKTPTALSPLLAYNFIYKAIYLNIGLKLNLYTSHPYWIEIKFIHKPPIAKQGGAGGAQAPLAKYC